MTERVCCYCNIRDNNYNAYVKVVVRYWVVSMYLCMCTHTYVRICMQLHMYVYVHMNTYVHKHPYVFICTHTYVCRYFYHLLASVKMKWLFSH